MASAFAAASITVGRNVARRLRLRVALVQVEAVLLAELQLLVELFPLRRELLGAADDPRDVRRVVRAADVRAGVADPLENRDAPRRALETRLQPAIRRFGLLLQHRDELVGRPASRRIAGVHALGGAPAQDVDVAEHRRLDPALVEILLQLDELGGVPADLRDRHVGAGGDLLLELQILVEADLRADT